jgi:hypothetical protein
MINTGNDAAAPFLGEPHLTSLLSPTDLSTETCLDSCDRTSRSAGVAGNEVQTVLSLVELGIRASAGLASNVFN